MTDIRPIRAGEQDEFLRVLCEAFEIDFDRAQPLFTGEPMYDPSRNWALFENGRIVSCLTVRPLSFGWGQAVGIAGVATRPERRQEGFAGRLMERVLKASEIAGEGPALLFARETALYEKLGFEPLDRVVRCRVKATGEARPIEEPPFEAVRERYDAWASRSPERLRRDDRRWEYWRWRYREIAANGPGYFTVENDVVREALGPDLDRGLPVAPDTEALALAYVVDKLELPFEPVSVELVLMGRRVPGLVQLFMTDQF